MLVLGIVLAVVIWLAIGYYSGAVLTSHDISEIGEDSLEPELWLLGVFVILLGLVSFIVVLLQKNPKGYFFKPVWDWPLRMLG